jgi:alpha-L-fucosidase 2
MNRFTTLKFPALLLAVCLSCPCSQAAPPASAPATLPANTQTDIEYGRVGDDRLLLDACSPDGDGPFPVVIIVHGGGWSGGDKERDITPLMQPLTSAGFTWFSINYRLAPKNRWPACFEDVRTAIRWVKANAARFKGDPTRIAVLGHSAGGHLVCLAAVLADASTTVQAIVGLAPVTDFEQDTARRGGFISTSLQNLLNQPKTPDAATHQMLQEYSPINHVKPGLPPFLLMQGDADKTVPLAMTQSFAAKLKENGDRYDLITVPGAPHALTAWAKFDPNFAGKLTAWLQKNLTAQPGRTPTEPRSAPSTERPAAGM